MKAVGKGYTKIDGMALATGKPVYTEDMAPKDALVIKILRSPHAYAKIISIDTKAAEAIEGVECILTYKDVPNVRFTLAGQTYPELSPYDRLILDSVVRYVGDEVAIVAAADERTALKALRLIKVKYEVLKPVLNFEESMDNEAIVHTEDDVHCNFEIGMEKERNIVCSTNATFGNVEEELKKCDIVIENTYYTQAQAHAMMETYRAYSCYDYAGRMVIVSSTQIPFHVKRHVSRALGIPASKIRVIKPRIGGGFGGKQTASVEIFPSLVTMKTGKPAIIIYDRKETFSATTSRHAMRLKVRLGAMKDGTIKVIDIEGLSDQGAYGEHAPTTFSVSGEKTLPLYNKTAAARFSGYVVYTNKMPAGALRGYGATQGAFALESAINELSAKLNMDPTEIRLKNIMKAGEKNIAYDEILLSSSLDKCIEEGKKMIGWNEKFPSREVSPNVVRAVGMAVTMQGSGIANVDTATVEIRLNDDGNYTLFTGATDMGTGSDTILSQMAAEILDTSMENITVHSADTDISPFDPGSYASSTTYVTGMAAVRASEDLVSKIKEAGAKLLGVTVGEVDFENDAVRVIGKEEFITIKSIAERVIVGPDSKQLMGSGTYGSPISPPPFVAGFAEVEVDKETGKVDLIDYAAVIDCGTVINPKLARIQAEGGLVQGIGMAMYEDVKYNFKGKMDTDSFMQYKIPNRKDINSVRVAFEESYEPTGPFGAKSIGEVVINTPPPAIAAAVYNAVGVNIRSLPITPEKVFTGMADSLTKIK
ncbi:xanthine dehydrogenase molybdenum-binding subunit [Oxobacter pfennigii]|uniref:Xanthine dehydrogenase molybdenum-binding subunit n=1 Tax=Oxobacter pfennigii TaxID=36849 RepID=A0A0P8WBW9_9CLOT|nr:molybdopterin cofactor-binding domain-containing protein [Oxobacter pfennigii]KPU46191.1 xanthine dehydrogenase molybdenum-binding subunit [Oxobacter pfennigii]